MNRALMLATPAGEREILAQDLPVRIGAAESADIRLPGAVTGEMIALIGVLDDRLFLQATGSASVPLTLGGEPVTTTRWLNDGDVVAAGALRVACQFTPQVARLSVSYADSGYRTLPPPASEAQSGEAAPISPHRNRLPASREAPRAWRWAIYAGFALLAAVALHLFTARAVRVEVEPAGAAVRLGGSWLPVRIGASYLLRPGSYEVSMSADGYRPLTAPITVTDAPSQALRFTLEKLPGRLAIEAGIDAPLVVTVDGQTAEQSDDGTYPAPAGTRRLIVAADRYLPFETTLEVEGRGLRQQVAATLRPNWADVVLATEPPGASVAVAGQSQGLTPVTVAVPAGDTDVELRKEGYKPWRQRLTVSAGQKLELPLVRLQESDGLLDVKSSPAGAAVTIDGRYRGTTPIELEIAPGRTHEVIVAKPGYETVTRSLQIEKRGAATLSIDLTERLGILRIVSDQEDARLWVNGEARGSANQELSLPAVAQKIEVRKAGFVTFATTVTPRPGFAQRVEAHLLTPQQAVLAATPQTLTTRQGMVLRLIEPGEFTFGAPRREQGRRPNETERPVRITRRYYLGTREISNREYREFKPNHTSGAEKFRQLAVPSHPAVMLSWEDAASYCNWLSDRDGLPPAYKVEAGALRLAVPATTGYRLPTEAEWEWASRYNGGGGARRYPWGDNMPPTAGSGNFADQSARGIVPNVLADFNDGFPVSAPVGSFAVSPLGLFDIGGNAAEWVNDIYTVYPTGPEVLVDPVGPASGQYHVIRGSSWRHASISELRLAHRDFGNQGRFDVGFRIARNAD